MRFSQKTHYFRIVLYSNLQFGFLCEEVFWEKFDYNASPYFRVKTVETRFLAAKKPEPPRCFCFSFEPKLPVLPKPPEKLAAPKPCENEGKKFMAVFLRFLLDLQKFHYFKKKSVIEHEKIIKSDKYKGIKLKLLSNTMKIISAYFLR